MKNNRETGKKMSAYFATIGIERARMQFYSCAGCKLIAKLIGVVTRVMCFQCGAFCV